MQYVYLLESLGTPGERYVGVTSDLRRRVEQHNSGKSLHISKFKPWRHTEAEMHREIAVQIDGMLIGALGNLDGIAHYVKNNLGAEEYSALVKMIAHSMAALVDLSQSLYADFPDIVPKELRPAGG